MRLDQFNEKFSKALNNLICPTIIKAWPSIRNLVSMYLSLTALLPKNIN